MGVKCRITGPSIFRAGFRVPPRPRCGLTGCSGRCRMAGMNIEKIRKRLTGGFRPFLIRTSDGREYAVPHPEFIAVGKSDVAVVDKEGDIDVLDALHIVSLRTPKVRNGVSSKS